MRRNSIHVGNCIDVLKTIPDNSIDLIFADPPFNLQLKNDLSRPDGSAVVAVTENWDRIGTVHDYRAFCRRWLLEAGRVLKDSTGSLWVIGTYHNIYLLGSVMQELGFWIRNDVIWEISNPMPNFRGTRFTNAQEVLIWSTPSENTRPVFNYQVMKAFDEEEKQMRSVWKIPLAQGRERLRDAHGNRLHPTQKPEALLYRIILATSQPGDLILDPFFGSGTTGVVAKRLGRDFIGIEQHREYVDLAARRINQAQRCSYEDDVCGKIYTKRDLPRISLAHLLERGFITPGTVLYFDKDPHKRAIILAHGHIRLVTDPSIIGSIHKVGKHITEAPSCNGWDHWYYKEHDDVYTLIDELRTRARTTTTTREPHAKHDDHH